MSKFHDLPPDVQQSLRRVLDYLLNDDREEAQDYLESENPPSHVWISITHLKNFVYDCDHTPESFARDVCDRS